MDLIRIIFFQFALKFPLHNKCKPVNLSQVFWGYKNDKYYEIEIPKNIGYKQALIKDYKLKLMYGWVLC